MIVFSHLRPHYIIDFIIYLAIFQIISDFLSSSAPWPTRTLSYERVVRDATLFPDSYPRPDSLVRARRAGGDFVPLTHTLAPGPLVRARRAGGDFVPCLLILFARSTVI